jgi:1-acyl-sn-glycerol-3-phosphate acyltransferase
MAATLRSLWIWFAIVTLIVLWLPLVALVRLFDRDPALYRTGRWFRRLGIAMTRVNPAWQVRVSGEQITDPRRPYVVVSNHQSQADIPIISFLPWEMKWIAKRELFRIPFVGWMMRLAGDIPVDRENLSRARVLVAAGEYLKKKCPVMFFPEGTRSLDGRVLPFTDGAFRLAIKAQVPVLPLVVEGSQEALPKYSWKFGPARLVQVKVLPPVETRGLKASETAKLREQIREMIVRQVAEWRGVPPEEVDAGRGGPEHAIAEPAGPGSR